MINGLEYIHSNQISHLDLKTSNLLLGDNYKLKIADFDLSYKEGDMMVNGRGSQDYRAPEVIDRNLRDPMAADIYSAGIILFVMMFGRLPFLEKDHSVNSTYRMFKNDIAKFFKFHAQKSRSHKKISNEFVDLFKSMVTKKPEERALMEDIKESEWYQ